MGRDVATHATNLNYRSSLPRQLPELFLATVSQCRKALSGATRVLTRTLVSEPEQPEVRYLSRSSSHRDGSVTRDLCRVKLWGRLACPPSGCALLSKEGSKTSKTLNPKRIFRNGRSYEVDRGAFFPESQSIAGKLDPSTSSAFAAPNV
ncbi:hypothetical protein R1flu_027783 [Riccia fluitans]|uniref:Uncharacterized protein n=1 Tax=Riccia fluitans TaxID=41844 RepID=A0ABD1XJX4_9MARC